MKKAKIFMYDRYAGLLTEDENGFSFVYDAAYLQTPDAEAISLTMPLRDEPYEDKVLFPFFDGLIPEGWLLNIAEHRSCERGARRKLKSHCYGKMPLLL